MKTFQVKLTNVRVIEPSPFDTLVQAYMDHPELGNTPMEDIMRRYKVDINQVRNAWKAAKSRREVKRYNW